MQKKIAQLQLARQRKAMRDYYYSHKDIYAQYKKENAKKVKQWYDKYRRSPKGKAAVARYEQSEWRRRSKALWNYIKRQKLKVAAGEISEWQMKKNIREYKDKRRID